MGKRLDESPHNITGTEDKRVFQGQTTGIPNDEGIPEDGAMANHQNNVTSDQHNMSVASSSPSDDKELPSPDATTSASHFREQQRPSALAVFLPVPLAARHHLDSRAPDTSSHIDKEEASSTERTLKCFSIDEEDNDDTRFGKSLDTSPSRSSSSSSSSASAASASPSSSEGKLNRWQSACILVNTISVGYLLLPYGFATGGVVLSALALAFVAFQSYVSGMYVLEACARAEALESVAAAVPAGKGRLSPHGLPQAFPLTIRDRKFELSELCRTFLGRPARNFFTLTVMGDIYGFTWALSAVFGSSLADSLPLTGNPDRDYVTYVLIFMAVTSALSCTPMSEQINVQLAFLAGRLLMVSLVIGTVAAACFSDVPHFGSDLTRPSPNVPLLADLRHAVSTLVLCVFASSYQFTVPTLTSETRDKAKMASVLRSSVTFVCASNMVLSLVVAVSFGYATSQSNNLGWVDYHGGTWDGQGDVRTGRAVWASLISRYVVLFGAIDGVAVYPLNAIGLGEILMGSVYEDRVHEVQRDWRVRTAFRLLASVPQAVGSIFVKDLGVIAKYSAIFTLLSYTVCPCLLSIVGRRRMKAEGLGKGETIYTTPLFASPPWAWAMIFGALTLIVGVIAESPAR